MENGSATLFAVILSVCFVAGFSAGAVAVVIEGPETIKIPEGTLIVPENGEPYYYFENGIVITNLTVLLPENYGISGDNLVITTPDYVIDVTGPISVDVHTIPSVDIMIKYTEDLVWTEEYGRLYIKGRPSQIWVDWDNEYYYSEITGMPVILIADYWGYENWLVFGLFPR